MTRCVWGSFTDNQCREKATTTYLGRPTQPVCKAHVEPSRNIKEKP